MGIDTCLPEIERQRINSYLNFTTKELDNGVAKKIAKKASYILNKEYKVLTEHDTGKKTLIGVRTSSGLIYSSLSMGTGEQRVIKILDTLYNATKYSLILIDEIDLLLHIDALKNNTSTKTFVYDSINTGLIYSLTGAQEKPIKVYVEDTLSQAIIRQIAKELNILSKIHIGLFGAAHNAFALAASFILRDEECTNTLVIIDGDEYRTEEEKKKQVCEALSGTEDNISSRQQQALSLISQYELPLNIKPEKYIHSLLIDPANEMREIIQIARQIRAVDNDHSYINDIVNRMEDSYDAVMRDIMSIVSKSDKWVVYTNDVRNWLQDRTNL